LQLLDSFSGDGLVIAATNHETLLDPALWRRFDDILLFSKPTPKEIILLVDRKLGATRHNEFRAAKLISLLTGMSHADIERICRDAMRQMLMGAEQHLSWETFRTAVEAHKRRLAIAGAATEASSRSAQAPE
jgi:SpoVK/Ycf46/Vps4 family AAA+-type ATPase